MMQFGYSVKMAQLLEIMVQVSSIWAKGCMFDNCVCVMRLDMTTPPWWREKVMVYYIIIFITHVPVSMPSLAK